MHGAGRGWPGDNGRRAPAGAGRAGPPRGARHTPLLNPSAKLREGCHYTKTGGSNGLVGELLTYGGSGIVELLQQLFTVIWCEEFVPPREGVIVCVRRDILGIDITLLSVVSKTSGEGENG